MKKISRYQFLYTLPGIGLVVIAFLFAGSHPNPLTGMVGFLAFFGIGVTILLEGRRQAKTQPAKMEKNSRYWFTYTLPGIGLIIMAFFSGSHGNLLVALVGFLAFFCIGVTVLVEGRRQAKTPQDDT